MVNLVTRKFRIHNAKQFLEAYDEAVPTNTYLFIGRRAGDVNEAPIDTFKSTEYDPWRSMISLKKIQSSDVSHGIPKHVWETNTLFAEFDPKDENLYDSKFYAINSENNVYKCLFNNKSANSTVEPTGTSITMTSTSDGYSWKYMYTVAAADYHRFVTEDHIPVKTLTFADSSDQWITQYAAVNGAISVIDTRSEGSGYLTNNGHFQSVSSEKLTLATSADNTSGAYTGSIIYLRQGTGVSQIRNIVGYSGSDRVATIDKKFTEEPDETTEYYIGPKVTIEGDGFNATAYANVATSNVTFINIITPGINYSNAAVTISANNGSGATAVAYVDPHLGHGADPIDELLGHNIIINVSLIGNESNTFPTDSSFGTIGLVNMPVMQDGNLANNFVYSQTTKFDLTSIKRAFIIDEPIQGLDTRSSARVVKFANTNATGTKGILDVTDIDKRFIIPESIIGDTSTANATIIGIKGGELQPYYGDIIYLENRIPTLRSTSQTETFKLVVRF